MSRNEHSPPPEPLDASASSTPIESATDSTDDAERQHLRAFVGPKADYYLEKWAPLQEDPEDRAGFNLPAFFLSGLWLPYRKMYRAAAMFFTIILGESMVEEILFMRFFGHAEPPAGLGFIVGLAAAVVCGTYGNRWYLSHARKVIANVHAQDLEKQMIPQVLSKRGGTSFAATLMFLLAFFFVGFAAFMALELLFGPSI